MINPFEYSSKYFSPFIPCSVKTCEHYDVNIADKCNMFTRPPEHKCYKPQLCNMKIFRLPMQENNKKS
jgi:hypothetical protein